MTDYNFPSDGMTVSGDFTYLSPQKLLSPECIEILTRYMAENRPAKKVDPPKVTFNGVQDTNSLTEKFNCCFTFTADAGIQSGDIVAICRLGWKRLRDILYYVPAEIHFLDKWISMYSVTFEVENLPKDFGKYELCYISGGNILGTSNPCTFGFPNTLLPSTSEAPLISENDIIEVEDPYDPGLVVFKSRSQSSDVSKYFDDTFHHSIAGSFKSGQFDQLLDMESLKDSQDAKVLSDNEQNESLNIEQNNHGNQSDKDTQDAEALSDNKQNESLNIEQNNHVYQTDKIELVLPMAENESNNTGESEQEDRSVKDTQDAEALSDNKQNESLNIEQNNHVYQTDKIELVLPMAENESNNTGESEQEDRSVKLSKDESNNIDDLFNLQELIDAISPSSQEAYSKDLHHSDIQKVISGINEVRAAVDEVAKSLPRAFEQINNSLKNSSTTADSSSQLSPNIVKMHPLNSSKSTLDSTHCQEQYQFPQRCLLQLNDSSNCLLYREQLKKNEKLHQKLNDLKESNDFLKSRVSVLELELCTINELKYSLLMQCIDSYEQENSTLKEDLDKMTKKECQIESLKFKCDQLTEENTELKKFIQNDPSTSSNQCYSLIILENKMLQEKCSHLESEMSKMKYVLLEEKEMQTLKSSKHIRQILLKQGHELAFLRTNYRNIGENLKKFRISFNPNDCTAINSKESTKLILEYLRELELQISDIIKKNYDKANYEVFEDIEDRQDVISKMECMQKENLALKEQLTALGMQPVNTVNIQLLSKTNKE